MGEKNMYQLVAINDNTNEEIVIELKNENKEKGPLRLIDMGTTYFKNSEDLASYLYKEGKIPNLNYTFAVKYLRNGFKYLPVAYNNSSLRIITKIDSEEKYSELVFSYFMQLKNDILDKKFYRYIMNKQETGKSIYNSGDIISDELKQAIIEYYNAYSGSNTNNKKTELQSRIIKELVQYKQFRTIHNWSKSYKELVLSEKRQRTEEEKLKEFLPEVNEDNYALAQAYKDGGMDEVYTLYDLSELDRLGAKLR